MPIRLKHNNKPVHKPAQAGEEVEVEVAVEVEVEVEAQD